MTMSRQRDFYRELEYTPDIAEVIKEHAEQTIALYVKNVPRSINPEEFYTGLARIIGYFPHVDEDPVTGQVTENTWTEIRYVKEKRTEAYKYSDLRHTLHTDYCYIPRSYTDIEWTFLFCINPADIGGATVAMDPYLLIDILQDREPQLYADLTTLDVIFERPGAVFEANTARIIDFDETGPLFCWSNNRISEKNTPEAVELCNRFHEFLETRIIGGGLVAEVNLRPGEALFFQDKRYLHGRNAFYGNRFLKKGPIIKHNVEQAKKAVAQALAVS